MVSRSHGWSGPFSSPSPDTGDSTHRHPSLRFLDIAHHRGLSGSFFFTHQPPCYFSFSFAYCLPHLLSFQNFPGPGISVFCSHMTPANYRAISLLNATTSFLASSLQRPLARNTSSFSFGPEVHSVSILYGLNKWGEKKKTAEEYKKGPLGVRLSESHGYFITLGISHFSYHGWSHYGLNFERFFLLFSKDVTLQSAGGEARPAGASSAVPCKGWDFLTNFRARLFLGLFWCFAGCREESLDSVAAGLGAGGKREVSPFVWLLQTTALIAVPQRQRSPKTEDHRQS